MHFVSGMRRNELRPSGPQGKLRGLGVWSSCRSMRSRSRDPSVPVRRGPGDNLFPQGSISDKSGIRPTPSRTAT